MNPLDYIARDALSCQWDQASFFLFSENVFSPLIYYSHLFPAVAGLLLTLIIWSQKKRSLINNVFALLALLFSIWSLMDLMLWATERPEIIMFVWSSLIYFEVLIYACALYLSYLFFYERDAPFRLKAIVVALMLPAILLAPSSLNLVGFDYTNCDREAIEGPLWHYYTYGVELLFAGWIMILAVMRRREVADVHRKNQIIVFGTGVLLFLGTFSWGNIVGSLSEDWALAQYGLFGMPLFLTFVVFLMVRYQAFNVKLIGAQALVLGLWILLLSLLFLQSIDSARPVIVISLALFAVFGIQLVRGVEREITQRVHIEELATNLAAANARLRELDRQKTEFVSIASHQLRSPLTAMTGYSSLMLEGAFGELTSELREPAMRIFESGKTMAVAIDDFLNVTRIEQGKMVYTYEDFILHTLIKQAIAEMQLIAERKNIALVYESKMAGMPIHADKGKVKQIITNLIDNAIKYTKEGSVKIAIGLSADGMASVTISDTGIGLSHEDTIKLFQKFSRADNANEISVKGTGLGLFIALEMARAQGGDITVSSPGRGKGTTFVFTIPVQGSPKSGGVV
jgi:signal transduction histidine kinase